MFSPCALPQSSVTTAPRQAFPAKLDGGSKGVPSELSGTFYVSPGRLEFDAFPQVEYLVWSCEEMKAMQRTAGFDRRTVILRFTVASYRFHLESTTQSDVFVNAVAASCKLPTEP